ncbi:MAG: hypothetical protein ACI9EF_003593 [Pseudohongiellaceae bacterium]|jgi:hypothetical protein
MFLRSLVAARWGRLAPVFVPILALALTVAAPLAGAQDSGLVGPPQPLEDVMDMGQGVLASVNSSAITSTDLLNSLRLQSQPGAAVDPSMAHGLRRQIAEQILLSGEAERLGIVLSDSDVENYWEQYLDAVPDFEALAAEAGTTEDRQRELARRSVLSEIFLYHKVGIWAEFGAYIKPNPVLEKMVDVTPGELRDLFKVERERFDRPATVSYSFYPCDNPAQAEGLRLDLLAGTDIKDVRPGRETALVPELQRVFSFSEALVEFLQTALPGQISAVFETTLGDDERAVVFTIDSRQPASPADFGAVQEELRRYLQLNRLDVARKQLVKELQNKAVFWPGDLFKEKPDEPIGTAEPLPEAPTKP